MIQEEVFAKVLKALGDSAIEYMVTGSVASIRYGKPRVTHDIDLIIVVEKTTVWEKLSKELGDEFYFDVEGFREMMKTMGMFNFIHPVSGLKVDCWRLKDTEYEKTSFSRRRKVNFAGIQAYFSTPEDVILSKLSWYKQGASARHLEDIKGIVEMQTKLDFQYIEKWAKELGILDIWNELIKR